jgi:hypothetical protein
MDSFHVIQSSKLVLPGACTLYRYNTLYGTLLCVTYARMNLCRDLMQSVSGTPDRPTVASFPFILQNETKVSHGLKLNKY